MMYLLDDYEVMAVVEILSISIVSSWYFCILFFYILVSGTEISTK